MPSDAKTSRVKLSGQTILLVSVVVGSCLVVGYLAAFHDSAARGAPQARGRLTLDDIPFNGARAYEYLTKLCELGPRVSGSPGMAAQQKLLSEHFQKLGGQVQLQKFAIRDPTNGKPVQMANLLVSWHPERRQRILLCAHYDTRPFPDRDPVDRRGTFLGANDGASGTAVLMEMAHGMAALPGKLGVDFALFDAEEFIFDEQRDPYFVGAEYFARQYAAGHEGFAYRWGVLLDMVGDANLLIYPDRQSQDWADTRPLVEQIWSTARRLGVRDFQTGQTWPVNDDHVKLHNIGGIACCDIIDFDYPAWHTRGDTAERCSALSLAKVGWVISTWLEQAVKK